MYWDAVSGLVASGGLVVSIYTFLIKLLSVFLRSLLVAVAVVHFRGLEFLSILHRYFYLLP